jgi:hypothetical protein
MAQRKKFPANSPQYAVYIKIMGYVFQRVLFLILWKLLKKRVDLFQFSYKLAILMTTLHERPHSIMNLNSNLL